MIFKKAMLFMTTSLVAVSLFACNNTETTLSSTTAVTTTPTTTTALTSVITTVTANSLYVTYPEDAYSQLAGLQTYRAEAGYYLMAEQGYNNWYYEYTKDSITFEGMEYTGSVWNHDAAMIKDGIMVPTPLTMAVRTFIAPATGEATIYGTVKMAESSPDDVMVKIMINDTQIYPESGYQNLSGDDLYGYFHKTTYSLLEGDEIRFVVKTEGETNPLVDWSPVVDYLMLPDDYIHFGMTEYLGDVHPYYYDGKLYMYYLSLDGTFSSTLATSSNMINFESQELTTTRLNAPGSFYFVLGVIKEGNYYRSFYGEGKNVGSSKSLDLLEWESGITWDEETYEKLFSPGSNYPAGVRDPYPYYNPDLNKFHIVATGYRANEHYTWSNTTGFDAYIVLFTSVGPSLSEWEKNPVTGRSGYHVPLLHFGDWVNNTDIGDPECSQIFKIGDRWYILASLSGRGGDHWVGRPSYWVGDSGVDILEMDWQTNIEQEYFLDGEDLCAAQVYEVGDKHYLAGWITQRNYAYGWGGTLNLPREVYQKTDGTLGSRLDQDLYNLINSGNLFNLEENSFTNSGFESVNGAYSLNEGESMFGYSDYAEIVASGTYGRTITDIKVSLNDTSEAVGLLVQGVTNDVEIGIRKTEDIWQLYLKNQGTIGKVSAVNNITIDDLDDVNLTIVLEGNVAEIYINGEYALSARSSEILSDNVSLLAFASGSGTSINSFDIFQLTPAKDFGH